VHADRNGPAQGLGSEPLRRALAGVARVSLTVLLDAAILTVALANGSARGELVPFVGQAWGFGPLQFLGTRQWHTLVTGVFVVRNPAMLLGILLFLPLSAGIYEARRGTARAAALFFLGHVVTLFLTSVLVVYPLHLAGAQLQSDWAPAGDVGASFGGFACLGAWIRRLEPSRRMLWIGIVTITLAAKLLVYPERFGDMGHLIAFFAGMLLDRGLDNPRRKGSPDGEHPSGLPLMSQR
jgi:hypothetical protein